MLEGKGKQMTAINYASLKKTAKEMKVPVTELLALTSQNDPFYAGTKSDLVMAEWFTELWNRFGYQTGVHLRRVHYNIQAVGDVELPITISWTVKETRQKQSTDIYINNDACWRYLCKAGKVARYMGMVDASAFVDRRNPAAIINQINNDGFNYQDPEPRQAISSGWQSNDNDEWLTSDNDDSIKYALPELPELPDLPDTLPDHPELYAQGYIGTPQPYLLEIWSEKSTQDDILNPLCEQYQINYIRGLGEMSITSVVDYLNRVKNSNRASRILYISDYDPAGVGMPISVSRKIEFYLSLLRDEGHDIALKPIVLNSQQIAKYKLPSAPVKDSDRRKAQFEAIHGETVELDSLEALHPGVLSKIVEKEILNYYDVKWNTKLRSTKYELQIKLNREVNEILEGYYDESLDDLRAEYADLQNKWRGTRSRFADLVEEFQPEIDEHHTELDDITNRIKHIHSQIRTELENVDIDYPAHPKPELPDEPNDVLFNSGRDYFEQLEHYQDWRRNGAG